MRSGRTRLPAARHYTRPLLALAAACASGTAGCASSSGSAPGASDAAPSGAVSSNGYSRHIDPFVVRDEEGTPYRFAFFGGLDVPRPQFIDIDADGDLDLFIQERSNELIYFENTGSPRAAAYEWRTDAYQGLDIGEWSRFIDLDGDEDYDMLAEQPYSYIRYYRNAGTPERANFVLAADSIRDPTGRPVFSDRQNIPSIVDYDCDGVLDLFIGRVEGTVTRYEQAGRDAEGVPTFRFVTDRFEDIEIVAQLGSLHGANSMAFGDMDGDGDLDLLWGDFFEPGLLLIQNRGTCQSPSLRGEPEPLRTNDTLSTSGYNAPFLADIDADGDLDLFIGILGGAYNPTRDAANNFIYYENVDGLPTRRSSRYLPTVDVGSESVPALADLDADGDLDLLLGNKIDPQYLKAARMYRFENTGTATAPEFRLADTLALGDYYHYAPALGDLDADGDLDMLLGTWNNGILLVRNEGSTRDARFVASDTPFVELTRGSNATPALGDVDGDGDLDLLVGESSGEVNFYLNTGTRSEPEFTLVSDRFEEIDVGRRSYPTLADVDGDGDPDLVLGSEAGGAMLFRNESAAGDIRFVLDLEFTLPLPMMSTPHFADVDADGDLDVVSGGLPGGVVYLER